MSHSGTRKRLKVRWLASKTEEAHGFRVGTAATVDDNALCGLPKVAGMHRSRMGEARHCETCKRAMGRSFRP